MRIKHLLFALMALPLLFVACKQNNPVDEVKNPTIELTAGEATTDSLSFTITTTEAENAAWLVIESTEATPAASEVLANGTAIEVNKAVECEATNLNDNTDYTIVAVVKNSKAVDKKEVKMTTLAADPEAPAFKLKSASVMEFGAEGGAGEIEYELQNPVEGTEVEAEADAEWITNVAVAEKISFTVEANDGDAREGKVTASYGDLQFEVTVKQAAKAEVPKPEVDVEFTASVIDIQYYGTDYSAAYNYLVYLSDVGLNESGFYKENGTYYQIDIYATDSVENTGGYLPNGTYKASANSQAGTFGIGDYGANIVTTDGVPTYKLYTDGTVTVSDGKIEATFIMENGEKHRAVFEGDLKFADVGGGGGDEPIEPADIELAATTWTWGGSSSYGNKYAVSGEGFSLDVHFPAEYASESALEVGEYIWTNTSWWGYNSFDNEFTTRSFLVDGAYTSIIKEGTAVVALEGDIYDIVLTLKAEDGTTYSVSYNGKLADEQQGGDEESDEVVFTKMEFVSYNSSYWFYEYKLSNDAGDSFNLCVNDYQANEGFIYTDNTYEWISIGYCGNLGYFSTRNINVGGTSYTASSGSMEVVTDESTYHMDLTVKLLMTAGGTKTFKFSGKVGEDNGNTEGGDDNTGEGGDDNTGEGGDDNTGEGGDDNTGEGGDDNTGEGGETASFENWTFSATLDMGSRLVTVTDGSHTVTFTLNEIAGGTFYINDSGALNAYDVKVNGVAAESASGTLEMSSSTNYHITLNAVINGVTYTGTSTNPVV